MNRAIKYFFRGLVIVVPIALTLYVVYYVFVTADRLVKVQIPGVGEIPGLGVLLTIVAITAIGALATSFAVRKLLDLTEWIFTRAPFVRIVYSSIKDLIEAFVGDAKRFDRPVLARLTESDVLYVVGFVTREDLTEIGLPGYVAVYLPQSYNFAGNLVLLPRQNVQPIALDSSKVMAFAVSGGVSGA